MNTKENIMFKKHETFEELQKKALNYKCRINAIHKKIKDEKLYIFKNTQLNYIELLYLKKLKMFCKKRREKDIAETIIQHLYTELQEKGERYMEIRLLIEKIQLEIDELECLDYDAMIDIKNNKENEVYEYYSNYLNSFRKIKNTILYDLETLLEVLEKSHINTSNHKIKHQSKQLISKNTESQDTPNLFDLH